MEMNNEVKKFEDPFQFEIKKIFENYELVYFNLTEIAQGGPQIGNLSINDRIIDGQFGGPILFSDNYVYIPFFIRKFFRAGFKLARINLETFNIDTIGPLRNLIFLDKIDDNVIHFFEDVNRTRPASILI